MSDAPLLPHCIESSASEGAELIGWLARHAEAWPALLVERGALLLRGFTLPPEGFPAVTRQLFGEPLEYVYRSTPRTSVGAGVYTATEYPPPLVIPQHSENAYQRDWPMVLAFHCETPAPEGGETPLSDNLATTARIPADVLRRFEERGVMYVRNYGHGVDLPWQTVFQTQSRSEVEAFCRAQGISCEWLGGDRLRTRQVCQGVATHPVTGQRVWFNQAHLFHLSSLEPRAQQAMRTLFKPEDLPRNAYYGDGSELEPEVLEAVRAAFSAELRTFPWRKGDVLLVDNMLVAHGRRPFKGPRRVLVSMGRPYSQAAGTASVHAPTGS